MSLGLDLRTAMAYGANEWAEIRERAGRTTARRRRSGSDNLAIQDDHDASRHAITYLRVQ